MRNRENQIKAFFSEKKTLEMINYWGLNIYFLSRNNALEELERISKIFNSQGLYDSYKEDVENLVKYSNVKIAVYSLQERLFLSFFLIRENEFFRFEPAWRECFNCKNVFLLGKGDCFEVYLGLTDKLEFSKHQKKIKNQKCPVCKSTFKERVIAIFKKEEGIPPRE